MSRKFNNCFITGIAGSGGSYLADYIFNQNKKIIINGTYRYSGFSNYLRKKYKKRIKLYSCDLNNFKRIKNILKKTNPELIFHIASNADVKYSFKNPMDVTKNNVMITINLLEAVRQLKINPLIIICSTSEVYGKNTKQPLSETDDRVIGTPQKIRWSYSDAKALEEATAHFLFLTKQLSVTTIRFFNTVGPRQSGKYGMVVPRFVRAAIEDKPLKIFGNGSQSRVFCHVSDSVKAVLALAGNDKTIGEVFNIGGKGEISILELAKLIIKQTNSKSEINFMDYEDAYAAGFEEMARRVPDISKLTKFTGWQPNLGIETIIDDVSKSYH